MSVIDMDSGSRCPVCSYDMGLTPMDYKKGKRCPRCGWKTGMDSEKVKQLIEEYTSIEDIEDRKFDWIRCPKCDHETSSLNGEMNAITGLVRHFVSQHELNREPWMELYSEIEQNRFEKEIDSP